MTTIRVEWHNGDLLPAPNVLSLRGFEGYDIHVLRGATSVPLRSIIMLVEDNGNLTRADSATLPADVDRILFRGEFAGLGTPPPPGTQTGNGVSLDLISGAVTATANPPTPRLRSFIVNMTVQLRAGAPALGPIPIRFHIHENVTEIWLTPSTLTLPADASGQRLTVLARFDDDTIGDITRLASAPTAPGLPLESGFTWASSDNVCVRVDRRGQLTGIFGLTSCTSTITATLRQQGWPALSATAQVTVIEPWAERRLRQRDLNLVGGPGLNAVNEVPNILLLPDGFLDTAEDRADFDRLAALAVHRLSHSSSTTPFDLLSGSINYWSAFVPSREQGTSTLPELVEPPTLFEGATPQTATPVTTLAVDGARSAGDIQIDFDRATLTGSLPTDVHFRIGGDPTLYTTTNSVTVAGNALRGVVFTPSLAQAAANNAPVTIIGQRVSAKEFVAGLSQIAVVSSIQNLVAIVGLPVPAERLAQGSTPQQLQAKLTEWTTLYGAARIAPLNINNTTFDAWARLLPDHRLADEKDTALGIANDQRPRAQVTANAVTMSWHPLRTLRTELDLFLATLEFQSTVLGQIWTIPQGGQPGKDRDLVFVLVRGVRHSGSNTSGSQAIVTMALVDHLNVKVDFGAGRSMQIVSHDLLRDRSVSPNLTNFVHATIAHEAAHSFGIADEYGGTAAMPNAGIDVHRTLDTGNVTPGSEVQAAAGITANTLRWRWPRILRAAVLAAPPDPEPGVANVFTIRLQPGHPINGGFNLFQVGDVVHLRQRPLVRPSTANPPTLLRAVESLPLTVSSPTRPLAADELQVSGTLNRADFLGTGSNAPILFNPRAASAAAAAAGDIYAEMMAQFIREHITTTARPLNASPTPANYACAQPTGLGFKAPQRAINLPAAAGFPGGRLPAFPSRIVGAYEGGATFNCNVFHPAGVCIMREQLADRTEQPITNFDEGDIHLFCPVCRYIIVDSVDPRLHGNIDPLYLTYPQP
jgi:hypothetical protein